MKAFFGKLISFQRWPAGIRWSVAFALWLALSGYFFHPASHVLDSDLDPSIFTAYAYYVAHGFQFGPQVVAMGGPYAFVMYGEFYGGDLFWLRVACELVVQGIFAALFLWFFTRQSPRSWMRWFWVLAQLIFTPSIADLPIAWTMLFAGFLLLEKPKPGDSAIWPVLAAALLGWLSLFKGTHLVLSFATVSVVVLTWIFLRHWRRAALILGVYLASVLGFWMLARQNPLNLPAYIAGTLHLTASYNAAMSMQEPLQIFLRGAAVAGGLILALGVTAWFWRRDAVKVAGLVLLAGYTFVMWKHGFVRADGHAVIFFCFAAVAVPTWYLHFIARENRIKFLPRLGAMVVVILLLLAGLAGRPDPLRPPLALLWNYLWPRARDHTRYLTHLPKEYLEIAARLEAQQDLQRLPEIQDMIGGAAVDYFGVRQGIVPLNGFNYQPRPMSAGTFNVYDRYLMELNRDFLRDPVRRPPFYLVNLASIDERLVTPDDGLALIELLYGYRPVHIEQSLLMMEAIPGARAPTPQLVTRQTTTFGQPVNVPAVEAGKILLARLELKSNFLGRIRAALYKPPELFIDLQDQGGSDMGPRRLIPSLVSSPFILSPFIEDNTALLGLYDEQRGKVPRSFTIVTALPRFYSAEIVVEFYTLPRPPEIDKFILSGLRTKMRFPYCNVFPESISPAFKMHNSVRYLHAPGEVVWKLEGGEREFVFHYGLDARAYEEGFTNGVEFIVEVRGPSGGITRVFSSLLRPVTQLADRGKHIARVQLPVFTPGSRLILRTDPGEYGDSAWDWSYVARMEIKQGHYSAAQFPGFNRVPDDADDEHSAVLELEGKKILLLHIPGVLRFKLTGAEKHLAFDFGFLPGAYTGEGRTAGGDYIVELQHSGRPAQELFRRELRPVSKAADRGQQTGELLLPAISPGDVLVVRTAAAPGATNSWGWTYLEQLKIE